MKVLPFLPQRLDPGATPTFTGLLAGDGTAAAPSISFAADTDTGWYRAAANQIRLALGGNGVLTFTSTGNISSTATGATLLLSDATGAIGLTAAGTHQNITLTPSGTGLSVFGSTAANTAYLGASPVATTSFGLWLGQTSAGAATYSLLSNGSRLIVNSPALAGGILFALADTEVARFHATTGRFGIGTGATDSGALLQIGTNTTAANGGQVFGTDTFLYRLGNGNLAVSGTTNPSFSYYAGSTLIGYFSSVAGSTTIATAGAGSPSLIFKSGNEVTALTLDSSQQTTFAGYANMAAGLAYRWTGRSGLFSPSDGVITLFNNATSDFSRLQFGGTTHLCPALKRNGTALEVRLADDSSHAAMFVSTLGFGAMGTFTGAGDGVFLMRDNAATSFGRLQFGGTTSSFPALSRSGVRLVARLADDSSVAELEGALVSAGAAVTVGASRIAYGGTTSATVGAAGGASALPATPTGYIIVNVAGTQMKVPYYAN